MHVTYRCVICFLLILVFAIFGAQLFFDWIPHDEGDPASVDAEPSSRQIQNQSLAKKQRKPSFGGWKCQSGLGVVTWRTVIPTVLKEQGIDDRGDIYEFGVFNAQSMFLLRRMFSQNHMWGFDSFEGLPKETEDNVKNSEWGPGAYKTAFSPEDLMNKLGGASKVGFVKGFYSKSLTPSLAASRGMSKAFYIDMDADLYISSAQALEWVFSSGLVRVGTLFGYDDWWVNACSKGGELLNPMDTSVGRAHREVTLKHRVKFRCVAGPCAFTSCTDKYCCWGPIFIVDALGDGTAPDHGFSMSEKEISTWKAKNLQCRATKKFHVSK